LLNAQNDFLSVWVNYEVQRRVLDWNLGTMQLDHDGLWIDPGALGSETGFLLPADCDDCQLECELFGPLPSGLDGALPDDSEAEELPPGEIEEADAAAPPLVVTGFSRLSAAQDTQPAKAGYYEHGELLQADLRVSVAPASSQNEAQPARFQPAAAPARLTAKDGSRRLRR
jgi:hypothetical protein